ncbi:MAG: YhbY family RNA-binding protein, partial [Candidatus Aphodomorpha sp.]
MKGKERAEFRKQANTLDPIFQIGKADIGDAMIDAIDGALEKRELIKISVLDTSGLTARDAAELLSAATGAEV